MFLLVGLGNPGPQYAETRHNVGFMFLDLLAQEAGTSLNQARFQGLYSKIRLEGVDIHLLKPLTFMNLSGNSVRDALSFFKIPVENLIVVFDDLDQQPGAVRMRVGGGHGGHNGMRDILAKLGSENFHRLKIGIGKPEHKSATSGWVLGKLTPEEHSRLTSESFPVVKERLAQVLRKH